MIPNEHASGFAYLAPFDFGADPFAIVPSSFSHEEYTVLVFPSYCTDHLASALHFLPCFDFLIGGPCRPLHLQRSFTQTLIRKNGRTLKSPAFTRFFDKSRICTSIKKATLVRPIQQETPSYPWTRQRDHVPHPPLATSYLSMKESNHIQRLRFAAPRISFTRHRLQSTHAAHIRIPCQLALNDFRYPNADLVESDQTFQKGGS